MIRLAALLTALAAPAAALDCERVEFDGAPFTVCTLDIGVEPLDLFLRGPDGEPYGDFSRLEAAEGPMAFAMNGGMYHEDRDPVGLYLRDGIEVAPIVTREGPGNFGMLPNGVLCLMDGRAEVIESRAFAANPPECRAATQSGPMLVIDGALHPRFLPDATSRNIRNGVGVTASGRTVVLAISDVPVTFHHFARLFRDAYQTPNALYLDGRVSRLHAPQVGRSDFGAAMGPILGLRAADALDPAGGAP